MVKTRRKRKRLGILKDEGGQAITEAALMMSLFTASWVLLSVVGFMASNGIRTVPAARNLAWGKGNGRYEPNEVDARFFHYTGMSSGWSSASLERLSTSGISGAVIDPIISLFVTRAFGVWPGNASFGPGPGGSNRFPFSPLHTTFPLQHEEGFMIEWSMVDAHSEWAEVSETFDSGVVDTFKKLLQ